MISARLLVTVVLLNLVNVLHGGVIFRPYPPAAPAENEDKTKPSASTELPQMIDERYSDPEAVKDSVTIENGNNLKPYPPVKPYPPAIPADSVEVLKPYPPAIVIKPILTPVKPAPIIPIITEYHYDVGIVENLKPYPPPTFVEVLKPVVTYHVPVTPLVTYPYPAAVPVTKLADTKAYPPLLL